MALTKSPVQDAEALAHNVSSAMVAPTDVIRFIVVSMLAGGHLLLHDLPGVGKTLAARLIAASINGSFRRIQFTPDLLPTDITGTSIYHQAEGRFEFVPGPIFANVVLADEINRGSPRTQAALLEAMAEGQVTTDGKSYQLPEPFWVIATQNEVDGYGTFPLPRAQLDRFMMALSIGSPDLEAQVTILERNQYGDPVVEPVVAIGSIREMQAYVRQIEVAQPVREYLARIVTATGHHPELAVSASPRAAVHLQRASQALAALQCDTFVAPEHVRAVALPVLAHRLALLPSATAAPADVIRGILQDVPVPF
ncbi:MAG: MoxR family ATPase [Chloroflexi bacterium]|nr:MoxR family ATPase [Chloroflexota bacterium]